MAVESVAIKLPTFWVTSPLAWFAQTEAQFALRNITQDETKYFHVLAALDTNTATRALSLLTAPQPSNKYGALKEFLISAFGLTDEERASTLLDLRGLGDYKPSELMDNMFSLLGGHTPCFLFKQIFMRQLPDQVRASLATSATSDYRALAQEAEKLFLATNQHTASLCSAPLSCNSHSGRRFLVDTGAQVSAVPASQFDRKSGPNDNPLQAANGTTIATYGSRNVSLCFNGRTYTARLIVADIRQPLLGADFFRQHNQLVDLRGQRLIEADTFLSCPCTVGVTSVTELAPIETGSNKFRKILQEFPAILQPTFSSASVKHGVEHHVLTTGPPVHARARRLAPDN
ncbi:retrovirus-related Pol polyprotein [Elysia marginata]|uniref:Retrovirus-related Pol polyprotein n=1 Tax=Elysia marginata TaxID=1093978 RepID=A0AAV4FF72_9GAST|nr:retrovirus-related Pol polyprotein [Elysia marginata]